MARHKDTNWNLSEGTKTSTGTTHRWESIHTALLMDIRDELKELNSLLHCHNFTGIPTTLRSIRRAMPTKPKVKR